MAITRILSSVTGITALQEIIVKSCELLLELLALREGAHPSVTSKAAAEAAGLSRDQARTMTRVASVPEMQGASSSPVVVLVIRFDGASGDLFDAQQSERMRRIGVLMHTPADEPKSQARLAA